MSHRALRSRSRSRSVSIENLERRQLLSVVNGVTGTYFDNADLTNAVLTRVDSKVNFNWGSGSPASNIANDTFSVRWTGQVLAKATGVHAFIVSTDDGVRLWVNGQLLINQWKVQPPTSYNGSISLVAGQKYELKMEYFENNGGALSTLSWEGPGFNKQLIPSDNLFTNVADTTAPSAPSSLTATPASSSGIALAWSNVANETGYKIERRLNNPSATWSQIATTAVDVVTYSNTGLTANTAYQYRVRAYNSAADSLYSPVATATTLNVAPSAPTNLQATPISTTSISLSWSNVANETGYKIERRLNNATDPWAQIATTAVDVATYSSTGLTPNTSYQYRVRAYNAVGNSLYSAIVTAATPAVAAPPYTVGFSTFLGGSGADQARDTFVDAQGFMYVTGGGNSPNFPTTAGAFDTTPNGNYDVYVTKYSPTGAVVWSTVLGGPNYDRAYGLEVDSAGYVYVAGRAGPGFPTTANAFQPNYNGYYSGSAYGNQNAFIAKIKPDGSGLVFATYFGSYELIRDLAVDNSGEIYVAGSQRDTETGTPVPAAWFANAYQKTPKGGNDLVIAKVKTDGSSLLWATYYGGSANDGAAPSIRLDAQNRPVVVALTHSNDLPTSATAYDKTYGGLADMLVAKFSADGSSLIYGTYLGGSGNEGNETHNLALDSAGNAYINAATGSTNFPVTAGAFQPIFAGGNTDAFISKLSADGTTLLNSTFYGGNGNDAAEGISLDTSGNVYITGPSTSTNLKTASNAIRTTNAGKADMYVAKFSNNLASLVYATYLGGVGADSARSNFVDSFGNIYMAGQVEAGFYTLNAAQQIFGGSTDAGIVKLVLG